MKATISALAFSPPDFFPDPLPRVLDTERLHALRETGLLDSPAEAAFDRVTALAARVLRVPVVLVSLVDSDRQFFKSAVGLPKPLDVCRQSPFSHSYCQYVVGSGKMLRVPHSAHHPVLCTNGATTDWNVAAYLGVPLRTESGHVLGAFCVLDMVPRDWSDEDEVLIHDFAALVETEICLRSSVKESQKQAQAARDAVEKHLQSEARFSGVTEASPIGVFVTDASGACIYANPKLVQITHAETGLNLLGNGLFRTLHAADRDRVLRRWQAALGENSEFFSIHRLGKKDDTSGEVWVSVKAAPMLKEMPNGENAPQIGWAGTVEDISDRKAAEDALAETYRFVHQVTETVPLIITVTDVREHQSVYANREFTNALGYSSEQVQGADSAFLRANMHPHDLPGYLAHMEQVAGQKAGEPPLVFLYRVRHAKGNWRWFRSRDTVFERDKDTGVPTRFLSIAEDCTPAKQHEENLLALTEQLQKSNASLQEFASVASHDLQEPLRKVQTFGDRLKKRCANVLDKDSMDYLDRMLAASARMQALIDDLLLYSRVSSKAQVMEQTDLSEIARGVLGDLEARIHQTGGVVEVGPLPCLAADPTQMRQLLQNLIGNALKFHKPETPPLVRVSSQILGKNPDADRFHKENRQFCRILIEDNGIGFEKQYAERVFDVFERLHNRAHYEGTGMGLAICRKIAQRHGGTILAQSSPETGTQIVVTLPLSQWDDSDVFSGEASYDV